MWRKEINQSILSFWYKTKKRKKTGCNFMSNHTFFLTRQFSEHLKKSRLVWYRYNSQLRVLSSDPIIKDARPHCVESSDRL
jgi:hypothetical protein